MAETAWLDSPDRKQGLANTPSHNDPDAPLVARLTAGDETALRELMRRHGPRLRRLAGRMNGRMADADDIVQEAFIAVWRHAARLRPEGAPFSAYLTRIVVNRCIDRARRERFWRLIGIDFAAELEDEAPGAEAGLSARSEVEAVARDLRDLPARQRAAILLASGEAETVADVAEAMGLSVGAAEQLLVRARRTLRLRAAARAGEAG